MLCWIALLLLNLQVTPAPLSFLELAKTNPTSLLQTFDTADPTAVTNIISILQGLIAANGDKVVSYEAALEDANAALSNANALELELSQNCSAIESQYTTQTTAYNQALGAYEVAKDALDVQEPKLNNEIDTLEAVLEKVKSLQTSGDQQGRRLLSFDSAKTLVALKEDPESFIESLAGADPTTLQTVVDLIVQLTDEAKQQLQDVIDAEKNALDTLTAANTKLKDLEGLKSSCELNVQGAKNDVANLEAIRDEAETFLNTQRALLNSENDTLQDIIDLLTPLSTP